MPDMSLCRNRYCPSQDECVRHTSYMFDADSVYRKFRFVCGEGKCFAYVPICDYTAYHEFQRVNKAAA